MKAPPGVEELRRTSERDAGALVTVHAEGLLVVAARAAGLVSPGHYGVHRQEIVRMDAARSHAPVVAFGAIAFLVAARAKLALVGCDFLVPLDPVGSVLGVVEPGGRHHFASWVTRPKERSLFGEVAGRASARGDASLLGVGGVAAPATAHARELIDRRELERAHLAVAARAVDRFSDVERMVELEIRRGDL
jgi:hypothetical protein